MDHGEHFGEIGSVIHLSKVRSHGIVVLSVRLSSIAIHSQNMYKNEIITLTMDNCWDWKI